MYAPAVPQPVPAVVAFHAASTPTRDAAVFRHLVDVLPPLGFHVLLGTGFQAMAQNQGRNLQEGRIVLGQVVARKQALPGIGVFVATGDTMEVELHSVITCPECGLESGETMPTDACIYFYECKGCRRLLKPVPGDCCVFCSFGSVKCPPVQLEGGCCVPRQAR